MARMNEKELATVIADSLNSFGFNVGKFTEEMSKEHRYLQAEFMQLCLEWLHKCRELYEEERYDGRNEYACKTGKKLIDFLEGKL